MAAASELAVPACGSDEQQKFLDSQQYADKGVSKYELIFGSGYISTGGAETSKQLATEYLDGVLNDRSHVLEVGCGIGGFGVFLADRYGCKVTGVDCSSNVMRIAEQRNKGNPKLQYARLNILEAPFVQDQFDLICSRDTILHIAAKQQLFSLFHKWLKPHGKVVITDYCCGPQEMWGSEFKDYVSQRCYSLVTIPKYAQLMRDAGFEDVRCEDQTDRFRAALMREKEILSVGERRGLFLQQFSEGELNDLLSGWDAKLRRSANSEQKWCWLVATKPFADQNKNPQ